MIEARSEEEEEEDVKERGELEAEGTIIFGGIVCSVLLCRERDITPAAEREEEDEGEGNDDDNDDDKLFIGYPNLGEEYIGDLFCS